MLIQTLKSDLENVVLDLGYKIDDIVIYIPQNSAFGDYATNTALQLAKQELGGINHSAMEIANGIVKKLAKKDYLEKTEIAPPGFINFFLKTSALVENLQDITKPPKNSNPRKVLIEYGHANILKEIHIGHLRTFILGESLSRISAYLGNDVFRANYQGDVGLHVARALFGVMKLGVPQGQLSLKEKAEFLGRAYALGNSDYEIYPEAKKEIDDLNTAIYQKDSKIEPLYQEMRQWSLDYFENFYQLMGIKYDRCFFESEVYELGKKLVLNNLGTIFEKSDGAIIFPGEKYGLHNRVFITSAGNPTYEAKEVGLAELEYKTFPYDQSIHVVGSEQAGYFAVVFKAIELLFEHLKGKKYHLSYGMVGIKAGKMSSRTGNIVTIDDLIRVVSERVRSVMTENRLEVDEEVVRQVTLGSIKFNYLKFAPSSDIVFDLEKSVSLQGDSGSYLQYTYARIQSLLNKAEVEVKDLQDDSLKLEPEERMLLIRLGYFASVIQSAAGEYRPNTICEYLIDLAKDFNLFYQKYRIIESPEKFFRLKLTKTVSGVLKTGLDLLGIETPERM